MDSEVRNTTEEAHEGFVRVRNNAPYRQSWGRYEIKEGETAWLPKEIADRIINDKNFTVFKYNQLKIEYEGYPKVYLDCPRSHGGIATHLSGLRDFCYATFVDEPNQADIIHYHFGGELEYSNVATCHGFYTDTFIKHHKQVGREINRTLQEKFGKTEQVISVSNWVRNGLKDKFNINSMVIRNGVDTISFENNGYEDYIFWSAYECPEKNPYDVYKVAKLLPNIKFIGITGNPEKHPQLKNMITYPYPKSHSFVKELMSKCRLFLLPSLQEAGPIILLEAMASGKGVVAYDAPGANELLMHGVDGLLSKYGDVQCLADDCSSMFDIAEEFGSRALVNSKKYDIRFRAREITDLYNKKPSVSVIILAYNNRDTLKKTIDSVPSWMEIIVGDADGKHKDLCPKHVKYFKIKNINPAANRNQLLKHATGTFVSILDGDDSRLPGTIEKQIIYMQNNPNVGATIGSCYRDNNGDILWKDTKDIIITKEMASKSNPMAHCSLVARRDIMESIGNYDPKMEYVEDWDLIYRLSIATKVVRLPIVMYIWHFNPIGRSRSIEFEQKWIKIMKEKNNIK